MDGTGTSDLLQRLFVRGLGETLILHVAGDAVLLGKLVMNKNRLTLSDTRYLSGARPADVAACFDSGLLGMVSASQRHQWSSLTFHGLNQCKVKVDLSQTRGSRLQSSRDADGDDLMDFVGSVYRGFRLMLDHHFLPVVTLQRLETKDGEWGFAVVDLRMAAIDLAAVRLINDVVRQSTERHLEVDLIEENVQDEKFEELFGSFLPQGTAAPEKKAAAPAPVQVAAVPPPVNPPARDTVVVPIAKAQGGAARLAVAPLPADATSRTTPLDLVTGVLGLLREVVAEVGAARAFQLFERWAGDAAEAHARAVKLGNGDRSPRNVLEAFEAISGYLSGCGETHRIVEQEGEVITHEIHDCLYREACRRARADTEGRWSTCAQAIPSVRARVGNALDGRVKWTWTSCDRRPGHPCVFEMSLDSGKR